MFENVHKALHLLTVARVCYPIHHTAGNGIPLRAKINPLVQKPTVLGIKGEDFTFDCIALLICDYDISAIDNYSISFCLFAIRLYNGKFHTLL